MDGGGEGLLVQQVSDRRYPAGDQRERGLSEEAADVVVERCMDVFVPFLQIKQEEQRQYAYRKAHRVYVILFGGVLTAFLLSTFGA